MKIFAATPLVILLNVMELKKRKFSDQSFREMKVWGLVQKELKGKMTNSVKSDNKNRQK